MDANHLKSIADRSINDFRHKFTDTIHDALEIMQADLDYAKGQNESLAQLCAEQANEVRVVKESYTELSQFRSEQAAEQAAEHAKEVQFLRDKIGIAYSLKKENEQLKKIISDEFMEHERIVKELLDECSVIYDLKKENEQSNLKIAQLRKENDRLRELSLSNFFEAHSLKKENNKYKSQGLEQPDSQKELEMSFLEGLDLLREAFSEIIKLGNISNIKYYGEGTFHDKLKKYLKL